MTMPVKIAQEKLAYIRMHLNDYPRQAIADHLGISTTTLYRYLDKMGAVKRQENPMEKAAIVVEHYPNMTARELSERFGISHSHILRIVQKLGLKHSPETMKRIRDKQNDNRLKAYNAETRAKIGKKMHRMWRQEYERSWEGKPQQTRLHLAPTTRRAYGSKWHLRKVYGYEFHPDEPYTMVITENTRRTSKEQHYVDKYHMRFVEG